MESVKLRLGIVVYLFSLGGFEGRVLHVSILSLFPFLSILPLHFLSISPFLFFPFFFFYPPPTPIPATLEFPHPLVQSVNQSFIDQSNNPPLHQ